MDPNSSKEHQMSECSLDDDAVSFLKSLLKNKAYGKKQIHLQKIYYFVTEAKENMKKLVNKNQTLECMVKRIEKKSELVKTETKADRDLIESLNLELKQSWTTIDNAYEKEAQTIAIIADLQGKLLEKNSTFDVISERGDMQNLLDINQELDSQNKELLEKLQICEEKLQTYIIMNKECEKEMAGLETQICKKSKLLESLRSKLEAETRKSDEFSKEIKKFKLMETSAIKSKNSEVHCSTPQCSFAKLHKQLNNQTKHLEKANTNAKEKKEQLENLQDLLDEKESKIFELTEENINLATNFSNAIEAEKYTKNHLKNIENEWNDAQKKFADVNPVKNIAILNENYFNLKAEHELLGREYVRKDHQLQETEKILEEFKTNSNSTRQECIHLKREILCKDEDKKSLNEQFEKVVSEMKKQMMLIKQMEKARDVYVHDIEMLKEKTQVLEKKLEMMKLANTTKVSIEVQTDINTEENSVAVLSQQLAPTGDTNSNLNKVFERMETDDTALHNGNQLDAQTSEGKQTNFKRETFAKNRQFDYNFEDREDEYNVLLSVYEGTKMYTINLEKHNSKISRMIELLQEKINLQKEIFERGENHYKQQQAEMDLLKKNISIGELTASTILVAEDSTTNLHEESETSNPSRKDYSSITDLKTQLEILETTLAEKIKEIHDKSECIKEQFEIIEHLKKYVSTNNESESEKAVLRKRLKHQEGTIKSLREKAEIHENYLKEYFGSVKNVHKTIQPTSKQLPFQETISAKSLQTKKILLKPIVKKY